MKSMPLLTRLRRALPLLYALGVFWGGVTDIGELPHTRVIASDKILHAAAFFGLEVLVEWALLEREARTRRLIAVAASIGVGGALELVQAGLPYRSADIWDLVADSVGAVAAALCLWLLSRIQRGPSVAPERESS
jgi:VanZ family protein